MLRQERVNDPTEAMLLALQGWQAQMWTALPCVIISYDAAKMTCVAQPVMQGKQRMPNGEIQNISMPQLLDVPVVFPSGGGYTLTFPIAAGDECLVVFSSRCIDPWWQQGGINNPQRDLRMHDLSDAFAMVGPRSQPRVLSPAPSTDTTQLRSDDGETYVEIDGEDVNIVAPGLATVTAEDVIVHGAHSYQWDVHGYGQKVTWTGGVNYTIDNYVTGAVVTTNNHAIDPPGPP